jgi:translation elongation factor EF-Ts
LKKTKLANNKIGMAKIDDIKKIREMTGASIDAIKMALEEAEGQIEKALEVLKKRGAAVAQKSPVDKPEKGSFFPMFTPMVKSEFS